jgi:hypothetical protein
MFDLEYRKKHSQISMMTFAHLSTCYLFDGVTNCIEFCDWSGYSQFTFEASNEIVCFMLQGVRSSVVGQEMHNKSQLDNIVGSLWQARQESSGSSLGTQVRERFKFWLEFQVVAEIQMLAGTQIWREYNKFLAESFISKL